MGADDDKPAEESSPSARPSARPSAKPELASLLATEHWSLLGTRQLTWSEIMSRISIMLTVLSAFLVVLALFAQGVGFNRSLLPLAIGFAVASLVMGALTAMRVLIASHEDAQLIRAMNRLRAGYVELTPEIEPYLTASTRDDQAGLMATYTLGSPRTTLIHIVGSTSFFVFVVNALVAGSLGALVAATMTTLTWVVVGSGLVIGGLWLGLEVEVARRLFGRPFEDVRFPSET